LRTNKQLNNNQNSKTRNVFIDKKRDKIYRKKEIKNKKFIYNEKHFQTKKYRLLTGCEKLHRTITNNIELVNNDHTINVYFSVSVNKSTVEFQRWIMNNLVKLKLGKTYYKREKFILDTQIKKHIILEYLYKNIHIICLKSVLEGRDIIYKKVERLKILNNKKNIRLYKKFIDKYKVLKKYYLENNCFFFSFWEFNFGPNHYEGL